MSDPATALPQDGVMLASYFDVGGQLATPLDLLALDPPAPPRSAAPAGNTTSSASSLLANVWEDHCHYYSLAGMGALAYGLGIGAALANTSADEHLRDFYQENVRNTGTDEWAHAMHTPTVLGNGMFMLPTYSAAMVAGWMMDQRPMGNMMHDWGECSLRTSLVGFPPMLLAQAVTGASRPGEADSGSDWRFWHDNNGVSGHSFMGAVPFITAAKMADDPLWKLGFYTASTAAGLSRINDDRHYASQVFLGWWMAYLAADAVMQTEHAATRSVQLVPLPQADVGGLGVEIRR